MLGSVLQKHDVLELDTLPEEGSKEIFLNTLRHLRESGIYDIEMVQREEVLKDNSDYRTITFNSIPAWLAEPQVKTVIKDVKVEKGKYLVRLHETHGPVFEIFPEILRLADENPPYQGLVGFIHLVDEYSQFSTAIESMKELKTAAGNNDIMSKRLLEVLTSSDSMAPLPSVMTIKKHLIEEINGPHAAQAFFRLGLICLLKNSTEEDNKEAIEWLSEAAVYTQPLAQLMLAKIYDEGKIVAKNDLLASVYYEVAAKQDMVMAQAVLADRYALGKGVERSLETAFYWRKKAADCGDAMSCFILGDAYEYGVGVDKNTELAYEAFVKAAQKGVIDGKARAAFTLLNTDKINVIFILRAVKLLEEAVALNSPVGLFIMGTYLQSGSLNPYLPQDLSKAVALIGKSARLGYTPAQKLIYIKKLDVGLKPGELQGWIQQIADEGDKEAQAWCKMGFSVTAKIAKSEHKRSNHSPQAPGKNFLPKFSGSVQAPASTLKAVTNGVAAIKIAQNTDPNVDKAKRQNRKRK